MKFQPKPVFRANGLHRVSLDDFNVVSRLKVQLFWQELYLEKIFQWYHVLKKTNYYRIPLK
jgi:hypothetical protein